MRQNPPKNDAIYAYPYGRKAFENFSEMDTLAVTREYGVIDNDVWMRPSDFFFFHIKLPFNQYTTKLFMPWRTFVVLDHSAEN